jgi:hypothetical protein
LILGGTSLISTSLPISLLIFPAVVTMDAHGQSLHEAVEKESGKVLAELLAK